MGPVFPGGPSKPASPCRVHGHRGTERLEAVATLAQDPGPRTPDAPRWPGPPQVLHILCRSRPVPFPVPWFPQPEEFPGPQPSWPPWPFQVALCSQGQGHHFLGLYGAGWLPPQPPFPTGQFKEGARPWESQGAAPRGPWAPGDGRGAQRRCPVFCSDCRGGRRSRTGPRAPAPASLPSDWKDRRPVHPGPSPCGVRASGCPFGCPGSTPLPSPPHSAVAQAGKLLETLWSQLG